jgi:hypothetical protein
MILNYEKYCKKIENLKMKYWQRDKEIRWKYTSFVCSELEKINPKTAIEMGTNKLSLMSFSDTFALEIDTVDPDNLNNFNYIDDANNLPWNIPDKKYDVFVALQVLEHLGSNQDKIFNEIQRISNYAIISLPYKWDCPDDIEHHMIDDDKISKWTNNIKPYEKNIITGRIILCYKF